MTTPECALPPDFEEWQRGVTCTVRPWLLKPIPAGTEARLNVTVRRVASADEPFDSFAGLYHRAAHLVDRRTARLACSDDRLRLRTWVLAHAWFVNDIGRTRVYSAAVTRGALFASEYVRVPAGEPPPGLDALRGTSGGTPESFTAKHTDETGARRLDEIYVDFTRAGSSRDVTVSYGEYVPSCDGIDADPIVRRARELTAFHWSTLEGADSAAPLEILREEWTCLATGKSVDAAIATVHLYFRV
jgi:hypothetical protein